jgi:hypothetical protein
MGLCAHDMDMDLGVAYATFNGDCNRQTNALRQSMPQRGIG